MARTSLRQFIGAAALLVAMRGAYAQSSILGKNLIVNGDAESGPAGTGISDVVTSIPNWTVAGHPNVLSYDLTGLLQTTDPAPPDHKFQYFVGGPSGLGLTSTLTQTIDVSAGASAINGGNVKYTASGYLGSTHAAGLASPATLAVAFKNAGGQIFDTITLGPLGFSGDGLNLQQQIGLVPAGTTQVTVTLTLITSCENAADCGYGAADSLSLVLTTLGTTPISVLGTNLVVNGGAEEGPAVPSPNLAAYIPGWSNDDYASVSPYGGYVGFITESDPGPPNRGVNVFYGGPVASTTDIYQDIDVSAGAILIDTGQVTYQMSAWLGGLALHDSPTLTYAFFDWTGKQLAATGQLGPTGVSKTSLVSFSNSGDLPMFTRRVHINVSFHFGINAADTGGSLADNISFVLNPPSGPPPFGSFDTPTTNSTVSGAISITGWALATAGIESVDVWRQPNPGETPTANGLVLLGTADIIAGSRPDVATLYPTYPGSNQAGWGFQVLSNELPSNSGNTGVGNGTYQLHAIAHDNAGQSTDLGAKTIIVNNAASVLPFGTIDTPTQGGTASGTAFVNFGWAVTPVAANIIPIDGSTIHVFIDNVPMGHPVYNNYRVDIATLFPGLQNSNGAVGYLKIDTTKLTNGVHTISWSVADSAGNKTGIGSRFFTVQN